MEEVTDTVFRRVVGEAGRPDVFFTEFTRTDSLATRARPRAMRRLRFTEEERPIVAQIWGLRPELFERAAAELREMGFDGVDLNMGCPVRKVVSRGAGGGMIRSPSLAAELIAASKEGAAPLPVSVKTRVGLTTPGAEEWLGFLLAQGLAALTVHGRSVAQQYGGKADWGLVALAVKLRDHAGVSTRIVGNGDVGSAESFSRAARDSGADGIMIGRGIFRDLFVFQSIGGRASAPDPRPPAWFLRRHLDLHRETFGVSPGLGLLKQIARTYLGASPAWSGVLHALLHARSEDAFMAILAAREAGGSQAKR
jgi:tRNA-dihydrouridine synthase